MVNLCDGTPSNSVCCHFSNLLAPNYVGFYKAFIFVYDSGFAIDPVLKKHMPLGPLLNTHTHTDVRDTYQYIIGYCPVIQLEEL